MLCYISHIAYVHWLFCKRCFATKSVFCHQSYKSPKLEIGFAQCFSEAKREAPLPFYRFVFTHWWATSAFSDHFTQLQVYSRLNTIVHTKNLFSSYPWYLSIWDLVCTVDMSVSLTHTSSLLCTLNDSHGDYHCHLWTTWFSFYTIKSLWCIFLKWSHALICTLGILQTQ